MKAVGFQFKSTEFVSKGSIDPDISGWLRYWLGDQKAYSGIESSLCKNLALYFL